MRIQRTGATDYGRYTKTLIAGDPGAGKTLVSSTWPNPFYASAEGGLMSIADRNIPFVKIARIQDLLNIKTVLDQDAPDRQAQLGFPIDTVVVDTIDEIQKILVRERLEETKQDTFKVQDWGWLAEQMRAIVRGFRNLDMHVVFTCHLKEVTDADTGAVSYKPALQGSAGDEIAGAVDLALVLRSNTTTQIVNEKPEKVTTRYLQTYPDKSFSWIKDRSGKLTTEINVDFHTDFERINDAIFGQIGNLTDVPAVDVDVVEEPKKINVPAKPVGIRVPASKSKAQLNLPTDFKMATKAQVDALFPPIAMPATEEPAQVVIAEADTDLLIKNADSFALSGQSPKHHGHGIDYYCENCGNEIETEKRADISKIRFRKYMCDPCFASVVRPNASDTDKAS